MNSQSPNTLMTALLDILRHTLASFAYNCFLNAHLDDFSITMENHLSTNQNAKKAKEKNPLIFENLDYFTQSIDIHGVLHLIDKGWSEAFEDYPDSMRKDFLILLEARNSWAHQTDFSFPEVVETAKHLLAEIGTQSAKKAVKKIRQLLRHDYYRHIHTTEHYIARPDLLETIQAELFQKESSILALHGMGGIGKSVLLRALCDEQDIQERFVDGILWMSFGNDVGPAQLEQKLKEWIKALNETIHDTESSLDSLKNRLAELLKNQACLLILDDVWNKQQLETFRVTGSNCRIIFSTRDAEIARETGAQLQSVDVMNNDMAIELLDKWSQEHLQDTPLRYKELIIESVGALPLAIKLAGAQLQTNTAEEWLKTFKASRLKSKRPAKNNSHDNIEEMFALSLDALGTNDRQLYTALSIFAAWEIPEHAILHLWNGLSQLDTETSKDLVTDLASRALCDLKIDNDTGTRTIVLHPLLRGLLYSNLDEADRQNSHLAMVSVYQSLQAESGWQTVPDDGYFYQYFPFHLKEAGEDNLLRQLLLDYDFIQTTLIATQDIDYLLGNYYLLRDPILQLVQYLIRESELVLKDSPEQLAECLYMQLMIFRGQLPEINTLLDACYHIDRPKLFPIQSPFRSVGGAFQYLSDGEKWAWRGGEELTEDDKTHLETNFSFFRDKELMDELLNDNQDIETKSPPVPPDPRQFLYPDGFFYMSGSFNIGNIHYGHTADGDFMAVSGDVTLSPGNFVTQSENGDFVSKVGIKVFNWKTGHFVDFVHTGEVNALAVSGNFVICASTEGAIRVWNWKTNEEIRTLTGYSGNLVRLTLSGEYVAAAIDMSVRIWNWQTGEHFCTFTEDEDKFLDVSLIEDEIALVTANHVIQVWNWRAGNAIEYSPEASDDPILSTILKGEWVFYLLENQSIKIANWRTKELISTIREFRGEVLDVVAQNKLLTALDNQLYLWDIRTGKLITSFYAGESYDYDEYAPDYSIQNAIVTPSFDRFIIGTQHGSILFLEPNPALISILRGSS